MRRFAGYILIALVLSSCSSGDGCIRDLTMSMKATLYKMTYDKSTEQFVPEKYTNPISLYGLGRDSVLYDSVSSSTLNIPLQKLDSVSSFVLISQLHKEDTILIFNDTIDFYHTNEQEFISLDCGCIVKNNIVGVAQTTHMIDSIVVELPEVNLESGNNIKIYLKN